MNEASTAGATETWITGAVVLDPDRDSTDHVNVLLRNDRIVEVVARGEAEPSQGRPARSDRAGRIERSPAGYTARADVRHVDGSGCLLMPGLIDCHAHVAFPVEESLPRSVRTLRATSTLRRLLSRGVTTVRDAAGADAGFTHALRSGWIEGPDLLVSLRQLGPTGGLGDAWQPGAGTIDILGDPALPDPLFDGPDAARAAVRRMVRAGADWIKLGAGGAVRSVRSGRDVRPTDAELTAVVDEARRCGRDVLAHAHTTEAATAAARAGARSIEHGFFIDETAVDAMRAQDCWFVPTLAAMAEDGPEGEVVDHRRAVRLATEAGVPIACGSDMARRPDVDVLTELRLLAEALEDDRAALRASTSEAARLLRLDHDRGRIEPGLRADLVLLEGTELDVARMADRVLLVWKSGREISRAASRRP